MHLCTTYCFNAFLFLLAGRVRCSTGCGVCMNCTHQSCARAATGIIIMAAEERRSIGSPCCCMVSIWSHLKRCGVDLLPDKKVQILHVCTRQYPAKTEIMWWLFSQVAATIDIARAQSSIPTHLYQVRDVSRCGCHKKVWGDQG